MEQLAKASLSTKEQRLKPPTKEILAARGSFRTLLAGNPNYFGNLKDSAYSPILAIDSNTWYEELTCIGFNPARNQLNATVEIKRSSGYGGDLCQPGSREYVRFFVETSSGWRDAGVAGFEVHDVPDGKDCAGSADKPLTYSVSVRLDDKGDCCFDPALPRVRAVLAWNQVPSVNPNVPPVWGNVLDASIQLQPENSFWCLIKQLEPAVLEKVNLPLELLEATIKPIPLPDPPQLAVADLALAYGGQQESTQQFVEPHRFGLADLQMAMAGQDLSTDYAEAKSAEWQAAGLDWSKAISALVETKGDVGYEELDCLAMDSEHDWLVATFAVKRPTGYSGDLCTKGSIEYVAFWADWEDRCEWSYLGTVEVPVHDISSIPADGLHYTALLRYGLDALRRGCADTRPSRIRAVLSWAAPPSSSDPEAVPYWGNRLDSHVLIKPGPAVVSPQPIIRSLGSIPVGKLDAGSGLTNADAFFEFSLLPPDGAGRHCPFAARVAIKGPAFPGWYYRLQVKRLSDPPASWSPLKTPLTLEDTTGTVFTPSNPLNTEGFFPYADPNFNAEDILGEWDTTGDELWQVRLELATLPDVAHVIGSVTHRLQLDNTGPEVDINIDSGGNCKDFNAGTLMNGHFVARDAYLGSYSLGTSPFGAPAGQLSPTGGSVQTSTAPGNAWSLNTAGMQPCGYVLVVSAVDRAIVNSGSVGHQASKAVGFCVRQPGT
jgi:hypothetical protein